MLAQDAASDECYGPRGPAWILAILEQAGRDVVCDELPVEHQVLLTTDSAPENGSLAQVVDDVERALRFFNTYRRTEHQREQDQERLSAPVNGQHRYQSQPDEYNSDSSSTSKNDKKSAKKGNK